MAKDNAAASARQISENPHVLIKYEPANAPLVLAQNVTKTLAKVQGVKAISTPRQLESLSETLEDAKLVSGEVETFVESLRSGIQNACSRVRELPGYEDFEATLTIRRWGLRQLLNDGIVRLRGVRAKYLADEEARVRREQMEKQAEQERINREAAAKAAAEAKKLGADKQTVAAIREEVMATPAPVVTSRAAEVAQSAGASVRYQYTAKITSLKSFLGFCLDNPVMLATLTAAIPDIEKAFRKMASDQKEAFNFPGITFEKTAVDVSRR